MTVPDPQTWKRLSPLLDELWDLLRQRRALRSAGQDPDVATLRDESTVERYEQ